MPIHTEILYILLVWYCGLCRPNAAEEAGKLIQDLPKLWNEANLEEQRKLLLTMLDAVYIDAKQSKSVIAVKPKPPFRPVFEVAAKREGSVIRILNGRENESSRPAVFLVEAGENRTHDNHLRCASAFLQTRERIPALVQQ